MADASLSTVLPANVLTLTFATRAFSPKAKQIEFVTSRNVIVSKLRLWLRPVPAWLVLPEELLDLIAQFLLRMLASAGMYARCSWAFKGAVTRAARLLEMDEHIIYWTGNSPPMKPPSNELSLLGKKLDDWARFTPRNFNKYMHGAEVNDIKPLLENSWCTNFTIHLCLKGAGVADHIAIRDDGDVLYSVPRLLEATLVARIGNMGMASFIATHPSWQAQLAATPFIVHPLNSHNTHWAALRVWQHGPAEIFESSPGSTDLKLVHLILMLLSAYGWAPDKRVNVYHFTL